MPRSYISVFNDSILVIEDLSNSLHLFNSSNKLSSGNSAGEGSAISSSSSSSSLNYHGYVLAPRSVGFRCLDQSESAAFCGGSDGACYVYGKKSNVWSRVLAHSCPVTAIYASDSRLDNRNSNIFVIGSDRGNCAVFDVNTCMEVSRASSHEEAVTWVQPLLGRPSCFLSAAADGTACVWDSRLNPSKRVVKRYECGPQPIHSADLLNKNTFCTMRLPRDSGSRRRSVSMTIWDIRAKSGAVDRVNYSWKNVDISFASLNLSNFIEPLPSGRYPLEVVTCGRRGMYTCMQCCDEKGQRVLSLKPTPSIISGICIRPGNFLIARPGPQLCRSSIKKNVVDSKLIAAVEGPFSNDLVTKARKFVQHAEINDYHRQLTQLGALGKGNQMFNLLQEMEETHKPSPNIMTFELVLRALLKLRSYTLIQKCLDLMRLARMKPSDSTAVSLLRFACRHRPKDKVILLAAMHHSLKNLGTCLSQVVREEFILLLLTNSTAESLQLAFRVIRDAVIKRMRMSQHLLQVFFQTVAARRATDLAYEIFHLMQLNMANDSSNSMKLTEFNSVAITLSLARKVDKVWKIFLSAVTKFGIRKCFEMACNLIKSYGRAGLIEESEKIVAYIRQSKPRKRRWAWEHRALLNMSFAHAALSCAQIDLAVDIFNDVPCPLKGSSTAKCTSGMSAILDTLKRLINVLEADGHKVDSMLSILEHVQDLGLEVPHECLVSTLGVLALRKRISEAMYLFNTIRHFREPSRDNGSIQNRSDPVKAEAHFDIKCRAFSVLISAIGRAGLKKFLSKLLLNIQADSELKWNFQIIENSLEALRCTGQAHKAICLWQDIAENGRRQPHTRLAFNNLIICHGMICDHQWCKVALADMKSNGLPPNADFYAACIISCLSAGRENAALSWYLSYASWQLARLIRSVDCIRNWFHVVFIQKVSLSESPKVVDIENGSEKNTARSSPPVHIFKGVRLLISKQQRLRRSSRSHPNIEEAFYCMIKRLVRSKNVEDTRRCLAIYYKLSGTLCPRSTSEFLRTLMLCEGHVQKVSNIIEWCLRCLGPSSIGKLPSTLFGRVLEHVLRHVERDHLPSAGSFTARFVRQFALSGGKFCSSILEAMLYSSWLDSTHIIQRQKQRKPEDGKIVKPVSNVIATHKHEDTVHLDDPLVIWQRAHQHRVVPSTRARVLLLRAIAVREKSNSLRGGVPEAIRLLKVFCDEGYHIHSLSWLISLALSYEYFEEALWVAKLEKRRNVLFPPHKITGAISSAKSISNEEYRVDLLARAHALHPQTPQQGKTNSAPDSAMTKKK